MIMGYGFEGEDDEQRGIQWMIDRLQEVGEKRVEGQSDEIEDLLRELRDRLEALEDGGEKPAEDWYDQLWDRFLFGISGVWRDEEDGSWEAPFEWGEWELAEPQDLKLGYSKELTRTSIPRGGGSSVHFYSAKPPPICWNLSRVVQKSITFYIGKAMVCEIDAVCSVPQLPVELDSAEAGRRVLNPKRGNREWQRRIEARRVLSIRNFIGGSENIIANSAILYAPTEKAFRLDKYGRVTIDPGTFLARRGGEWTDHLGKNDLRPLWLIDGQHRIRGLSQSEQGIDLEVPVILFPPEFSLSQSAKSFAAINTLQKKLSPLHTLFMQHRFGIPSPVAKRDFRRPWKPSEPESWDSRANHLAYECAAYLTSSASGPLEGRIRILDQNAPRFSIMQASQWVDFSRSWFMRGSIYGPDCSESQPTINKEVENYFRAFVETCNHDGWEDGRPRWVSGAKNKGLIQRHGPSQSLLRIYPTVWKLARRGERASPIPEERFKEVLQPLTWVDWLDERLIPVFGGSGERPRTALRVWMETAITNGKSYSLSEVMSSSIHSEAGKGMLASPGNGTLSISDGSPRWPQKGRPVVLRASQPKNTLLSSRWIVIDSNETNRSPENPIFAKPGGYAEYTLQYDSWMDSVAAIRVHVDWYNTVSPPGSAELTLCRAGA